MRRPIIILLTPASLILTFASFASAVLPDDQSDRAFESRVRPILAEHCFECHGPSKQMSGLRLDSRAGVMKGGSRGPAVVAFKPDQSLLVTAIHRTGSLKMPPAGPLKPSEIAVLSEWIQSGAVFPTAANQKSNLASPKSAPWSFKPVRLPPLPTSLGGKSNSRNPIDAFILADLAKKGLAPAPAADRRTLVRRAYFDLIGLPPSPQEMSAYLADSSGAWYAGMIDKLLSSPHYGERWGRHWLDVARYTDSLDARSLGAEGDLTFAYRYRDWVVDAFNRDLPYDRFIADQIAGDILPAEKPGEYNREGVIATGFLAVGNWGNGDADKDKILTDIADDQVDAVSRAFMGLTVACARCHDHKFDPITQRDYYAMAGIFFSTHILAKLTPKGAGENLMRIPLASPQELERRSQHAARLKETEAKVTSTADQVYTRQADIMRPEAARYLLAAWDYQNRPKSDSGPSLAEYASKNGQKEYALRQWIEVLKPGGYRVMTTAVRDVASNPGVHAWKGPGDTPSITVNTNDSAKAILTFNLPAKSVSVHPAPAHGVAVAWRSPVEAVVRISGSLADADPVAGDGVGWSIYALGDASREVAKGDIANAGRQDIPPATVSVRPGTEIQLRVLPKTSHTCDTTVVTLQIEDTSGTKRWNLTADALADPLRSNPRPDSYGNPDVWRFMDMSSGGRGAESPDSPKWEIWDSAVRQVLESNLDRAGLEQAAAEFGKTLTCSDDRNPFRMRRAEDEQYLDPALRDTLTKLRFDLYGLQKSQPPPLEYANGALEGGVPESPHAGIHNVKIHIRGRYDRLGEETPRGFPAAIAVRNPPVVSSGSGRLELAKWLASPDHPLTARVMVNRIWQHHFGEGIVRTPGNFGKLGEPPTNPALLDYLAWRFRENGWSVKKLHREIMLSEAYRRSSAVSADAKRKDPDNRLFGRMNRRRLDAETFRDALLSMSGELDTARGGPAIRDINTKRRTLYVMTVRSDRTGYGPLFDMPDSTNVVDQRTVTTVAPQALFVLNNPFVRDRAAALAGRLTAENHPDSDSRIQSAYSRLFGRRASEEELRVGHEMLAAQDGDPKQPLERWIEYCQVLLSSNEFMYVD